jgi:hypothetical protein
MQLAHNRAGCLADSHLENLLGMSATKSDIQLVTSLRRSSGDYPRHPTTLGAARHERASLFSCVGEPLKSSVIEHDILLNILERNFV